MPVIVNASPIAAGLASSPVNATAKSSLCVMVHWVVPSPCTMTGLPVRIRSSAVQPPSSGISVLS